MVQTSHLEGLGDRLASSRKKGVAAEVRRLHELPTLLRQHDGVPREDAFGGAYCGERADVMETNRPVPSC